jgi:hypothetical protein
MEENENQVQTMEETKEADQNYDVAEASMNLDGDITNFEVLDESQATNPEPNAAAFVGTSNNAGFEPGNVSTVDNAATSPGTSVQGPPHVPESISGDGQEDVPDDLTADYSAKDHVVDAVMGEVEKQPTDARGNVEEGEWTVPKDNISDVATKAMEAPKQQTLFKTVTASRVSLSPPPNAANRNDGISPVRNAMPSQQANLNSAGLTNMDLNQTNVPLDNTTDFNAISNENQHATLPELAFDDDEMQKINDDNSVIVVPGIMPYVHPEAGNLDQFGTDANIGLDAEMDLSANAKGSANDIATKEIEKHPTPRNVGNLAPNQAAGLNTNFSNVQEYGRSSVKPKPVNYNSFSHAPGAQHKNASSVGNAQSRPFSFAQATKNAKAPVNAAGTKDISQTRLGNTKTASVAQNATTITPPGRGRNVEPDAATHLARPVNATQMNTTVTPDATMHTQKHARLSMPVREMQKQSALEDEGGMFGERMRRGTDNSNFSPPPTANVTNSTTPKTGNAQNHHVANPSGNQHQPKDALWNLAIADSSYSNLSFDELLNQFLQDIQEAADLHEQGENELLDLEVDLSHAMAAALRYKGDMMDLLDEIEITKAAAERVLAQFAE